MENLINLVENRLQQAEQERDREQMLLAAVKQFAEQFEVDEAQLYKFAKEIQSL